MTNSIVLDKAIKFALRIVGVYKHSTEIKHEFILSKQLLLSAALIAKHTKSALHSSAKQGFSSEMYVALQRALDTELWLLLLKEGDFLSEPQSESLNNDCVELIKMTSKISKTSRED